MEQASPWQLELENDHDYGETQEGKQRQSGAVGSKRWCLFFHLKGVLFAGIITLSPSLLRAFLGITSRDGVILGVCSNVKFGSEFIALRVTRNGDKKTRVL
ncbi:MAG: hypothetical protein JW384_00463 [Nitrosomonadaceae bacterium]|nr:hypothetical protein [Nitrosomonadaceae bacterium]